MTTTDDRMRTFDWGLAWTALILTSSMIAMPVSVTPTFERMLAESGRALPVLTLWVLAGWLPIVAALPPAVFLAIAWRRPQAVSLHRRPALALAALSALLGAALCLAGYAAALFSTPA